MIHYKQLKKAAAKRADENFRFRCFLKNMDEEEIDRYVHAYAKEHLTSDVCAGCQNCCRALEIILNDEDITRIAHALHTSEDIVKRQYVKTSKDGELEMKKKPCPFMKTGVCSIYANRPTCCKDYPYLEEEDFVFRLWGVLDNAHVCPVVYQLLEDMKEEYAEAFSKYLDEYGAMIG